MVVPASLPWLVVTAGFCAIVAAGVLDSVDRGALLWLRNWVGDSGIVVNGARAMSALGDWSWRIVVAVALALWLGRRGKPHALLALIMASVSIGYATDVWLKPFFRRPRPEIVAHLTSAEGWSLPSGHAAGAVATFALAAWLMAEAMESRRVAQPVRIAGATIAFLIGLSRPLLGVHWPSDVVAGWLVGTCVALLSVDISRYVSRAKRQY